jgi:hypothetical protein
MVLVEKQGVSMDFTDRLEALLRESRATGSIDEYLKWLELVKLLVDHAPALLDVVKAAQEVCKECGVCGGSGRENYEDDNGEYVAEACGQCSELRQALTRLSERRGE